MPQSGIVSEKIAYAQYQGVLRANNHHPYALLKCKLANRLKVGGLKGHILSVGLRPPIARSNEKLGAATALPQFPSQGAFPPS